MDRDRCLDVIAEAVDDHRRELKVISRGLDLCESTLCSDVADVRAWVTSALEEQQMMMVASLKYPEPTALAAKPVLSPSTSLFIVSRALIFA